MCKREGGRVMAEHRYYHFTRADFTKISRWLEKGKTLENIAIRYDMDAYRLMEELEKAGVPVPDKCKPSPRGGYVKVVMPPQDVEMMQELYEAGWSLERIAGKYPISKPTVKRILVEHGTVMRDPWEKSGESRRTPISLSKLHRLYVEQGKTQEQVAKILGRSRNAIRKELYRQGWSRGHKHKTNRGEQA